MKLKVNPEELTNQKIAWILRLIAAAYTIKGGPYFKIVAYNNAADEVEHLGVSLRELWEHHKETKITNIGESIKGHILDLFTKGESEHFNHLLADIHPAVGVLIKVPGIGPKVAFKLTENFSFPTRDERKVIETLIRLAEEHKIQQLPNFKEKSEQRLKKLAEEYLQLYLKKRFLLVEALNVAEPLVEYIKKIQGVKDVELLGSVRRRLATVGDIDIAVETSQPRQFFDLLKGYPLFKSYEILGKAKSRLVLDNGYRVDVITATEKEWGSLIQYLTGSKFHNIALREFALKKGFSLSEHGIKEVKSGHLHHFSDEKEFYKFLGLHWIVPELRENRGEIEAAKNNTLPKLVTLNEVRGDLHLHSSFNIHTNYDLGENSVLELAEEAKKRGYEYLAISDHLPRPSLPVGEKIRLIQERNRLISQAEKKTGLRIFRSLEVDILPNGELALEEEVIKLLEFLIVSVHTSFNLGVEEMTQRVIKGLSHPKTRFLAHPTGRLLNKRKGYQLNWKKLFAFLKKENKALEINSTPERLDISDEIVFAAVKNGVKLIINTDSHKSSSMGLMRFGIWVARRGWATPESIVNTLPLKQIEKWLLSH